MWISNNQRNRFSSSRLKRRNQFNLEEYWKAVYSNANWNFSGILKTKLFPKRKTFSQRKLINCLFNNRPYMFCWFSTAGEMPWKTINSPSVMKIHFLLSLWHLPTVSIYCLQKNNHHDLWTKSTETEISSEKARIKFNFEKFSNQVQLIFGL